MACKSPRFSIFKRDKMDESIDKKRGNNLEEKYKYNYTSFLF